MGDVLVDAAHALAGRRILRQIEGHNVTAHALTHAHPDHQGASQEVCERLGIPYWVGERDASRDGDRQRSSSQGPRSTRVIARAWGGPPHPVARRLREGDEVAGFEVLDVPGHSPGHVAYWRESDRVLIAGDVMNGMNLRHGHPRPARAAGDVHPRPGAQPRVDPAARGAAPVARLLRPRAAAARHGKLVAVRRPAAA